MNQRQIYSVTELSRRARRLLEEGFGLLWLEAEISNFVAPGSGHWYFSLKDEGAQVKAACFRNRNQLFNFKPKDGDKVLVRARVTLYEARGDFQLAVEYMEPAGAGRLQQQFDALKLKLEHEGLFAPTRKKPLPVSPLCVGVITSATGAAIHDVLTVLKRRAPQQRVIIYPTLVQGAEAPASIIQALQRAYRRNECDVLLLTRGGGSFEDLFCFNDEKLARVIAQSPLPIVSAVGHEIDFCIADFIADVRAPTPSAAAEILVPDAAEQSRHIRLLRQRLSRALALQLQTRQHQLRLLQSRLRSPDQLLSLRAQRLDELQWRLHHAVDKQLQQCQQRLWQMQQRLQRKTPQQQLLLRRARLSTVRERLLTPLPRLLSNTRLRWQQCAATLHAISPLATLQRGYSLTRIAASGQIVRGDTTLAPDCVLETLLPQRRLLSQLLRDEPIPEKKDAANDV